MSYPTSVANQIIPGYSLLSEAERTEFENSDVGRKFKKIVESLSLSLTQLNSMSWFAKMLTADPMKNEGCIQEELKQQKKELMLGIGGSTEYKKLMLNIVGHMLNKEIEYFTLLSPVQQELLCSADFSKKLLNILLGLDAELEQAQEERNKLGFMSLLSGKTKKADEKIHKLQAQRIQQVEIWHTEFSSHPSLVFLRQRVAEQKELLHQQELQVHAERLSTFLPLLHYRIPPFEEAMIQRILKFYRAADGSFVSNPKPVDVEILNELIFYCMNQVSQAEISFADLHDFNKTQAQHLTQVILKAFDDNTNLDWDVWLAEYGTQLHDLIIHQLQLVEGKDWDIKTGQSDDLLQSLSFLWKNPVAERASNFLTKLADAHAFIQATGFSTKGEGYFSSILDLYNYNQVKEQIAEARSIASKLLSPLQPIYDEYKNIAMYEKNTFMKVIRGLIPILIVIGIIIAALALTALASAALPELAFFLVAIPALIVGLVLATVYVHFKNDIYNSLREWYYKGPFEVPEFQINERMRNAFGDEKAEQVRAFYVEELQKCDALEGVHAEKHSKGILSQDDLELRKENTQKRMQLTLEWYDIHSNNDLNFEQASVVVATRVQQEYLEFKNCIQKESPALKSSIEELITDLKTTLNEHIDRVSADTEDTSKEIKEPPLLTPNYRHGLFKVPTCLKAKEKVEELAHFNPQC